MSRICYTTLAFYIKAEGTIDWELMVHFTLPELHMRLFHGLNNFEHKNLLRKCKLSHGQEEKILYDGKILVRKVGPVIFNDLEQVSSTFLYKKF